MDKKLKIFYGFVGAVILTIFGFFLFYEGPKPTSPEPVKIEALESEAQILFENFVSNHELTDASLFEVQGYFEEGNILQINEVIQSNNVCYSYTKFYYTGELQYSILPVEWNMDKPLTLEHKITMKDAIDAVIEKGVIFPEHTIAVMRSPIDDEGTWFYFQTTEKVIARVNADNGVINIF